MKTAAESAPDNELGNDTNLIARRPCPFRTPMRLSSRTGRRFRAASAVAPHAATAVVAPGTAGIVLPCKTVQRSQAEREALPRSRERPNAKASSGRDADANQQAGSAGGRRRRRFRRRRRAGLQVEGPGVDHPDRRLRRHGPGARATRGLCQKVDGRARPGGADRRSRSLVSTATRSIARALVPSSSVKHGRCAARLTSAARPASRFWPQPASKHVLRFVDLCGDVVRSALVGMVLQHQPAMRGADVVVAGAFLQTQHLQRFGARHAGRRAFGSAAARPWPVARQSPPNVRSR